MELVNASLARAGALCAGEALFSACALFTHVWAYTAEDMFLLTLHVLSQRLRELFLATLCLATLLAVGTLTGCCEGACASCARGTECGRMLARRCLCCGPLDQTYSSDGSVANGICIGNVLDTCDSGSRTSRLSEEECAEINSEWDEAREEHWGQPFLIGEVGGPCSRILPPQSWCHDQMQIGCDEMLHRPVYCDP